MSVVPPKDRRKDKLAERKRENEELRSKVRSLEQEIMGVQEKKVSQPPIVVKKEGVYNDWPIRRNLKELRDALKTGQSSSRYFVREIEIESVLKEVHAGDWYTHNTKDGLDKYTKWTVLPDYKNWTIERVRSNNRSLEFVFQDHVKLSIDEFDRLTSNMRYQTSFGDRQREIETPMLAISCQNVNGSASRNVFIIYKKVRTPPRLFYSGWKDVGLFWIGRLDAFQKVLEAFNPFNKMNRTLLYNNNVGYNEVITS